MRSRSSLVAEVHAAADEFDQAQLRADCAALVRYLAVDFVFVCGAGKVAKRDAFIATFASTNSTMEPFELINHQFIMPRRDSVFASAEVTLRGRRLRALRGAPPPTSTSTETVAAGRLHPVASPPPPLLCPNHRSPLIN